MWEKPQIKMKEVILEFIVYGSYVKVSAVDPISGTEVSIVGDRKAEQSYLESVATKKLAMVMKKNAQVRRHGFSSDSC